jgi:hypothetical protein
MNVKIVSVLSKKGYPLGASTPGVFGRLDIE